MKVEPAKERLDAPTFTAVIIRRSYAVRVLPIATEVAIAMDGVRDRRSACSFSVTVK
jgi:hypothetical protein